MAKLTKKMETQEQKSGSSSSCSDETLGQKEVRWSHFVGNGTGQNILPTLQTFFYLFQSHVVEKYEQALMKITQLEGEQAKLRTTVDTQSEEIHTWVEFPFASITVIELFSKGICRTLIAVFGCFSGWNPDSEKKERNFSKWITDFSSCRWILLFCVPWTCCGCWSSSERDKQWREGNRAMAWDNFKMWVDTN